MMLLHRMQHALYALSPNPQNPDIERKTVEKRERERGKRELEIDIKTVERRRKKRRVRQ